MAKRRGRRRRRQRRIFSPDEIHVIIDGADFINSMPDEILRHILSFVPTDLAIRTSVLSRRWRHVWCELSCLKFKRTDPRIDQILVSYRALRIMSFGLCVTNLDTASRFDRWLEFAMSRNVEKLSLSGVDLIANRTYRFPDFFCLSSSLTKLKLVNFYVLTGCTVSWNSLRRLKLSRCNLDDEFIANILSGSPILKILEVIDCGSVLPHLDRSSLGRLEIVNHRLQTLSVRSAGPIEIVAPHIRCLYLTSSDVGPCTLVDVSSLAVAYLHICMDGYDRLMNKFHKKAGFLQTMVLKLLAELQNVKRLHFFKGPVLQILSLAELFGVPFPTLKVQTLIVQPEFVRSVIPGIERLLQNSPGLKNLMVIGYVPYFLNSTIEDMDVDMYLRLKGLNPDKCWRSKYGVFPTSEEICSMSGCNDRKLKLMASFMELVLRNAKTLEKMVVWLGCIYFNDEQLVEELIQMVGTLSHNNNVSIVLKRRNCKNYWHHCLMES